MLDDENREPRAIAAKNPAARKGQWCKSSPGNTSLVSTSKRILFEADLSNGNRDFLANDNEFKGATSVVANRRLPTIDRPLLRVARSRNNFCRRVTNTCTKSRIWVPFCDQSSCTSSVYMMNFTNNFFLIEVSSTFALIGKTLLFQA